MADIRTLKLALLADTKNFIDGLDKADKETKTFSNKLDDALQKGAAAFLAVGAAAGAMAIKIGIDAVKAAIEDEKAQASLAQTLRNTTNATEAQIAATEEFIDKTARATGVADDQLRPSLQRLLVSTKDLTQAQKLQALALDISAGTGKDLLSVSDALAKASDGNFKALKNLGVELKTSETITKKVKVSQTDLKEAQLKNEDASLRLASAQERLNKAITKNGADSIETQKAQNAVERAQISLDKASGKYNETVDKQGKTIKVTKEETISFDEAVKQLTANFEGQADIAANTFAGRMGRIKIAIEEAKEQLGTALLPLLERFAKFATNQLAPALQGLVDGLTGTGKQSLTRAFYDVGTGAVTFGYDLNNAQGSAYLLGEEIRLVAKKVGDFVAQLSGAANDKGLQGFLDKIIEIINAIETAIGAYNRLPDVGKLLVNPAPQLLSLAPAVKGATGTVVNVVNNVKSAITDPLATARAIQKVTSTAFRTTGLR